MPIYRQLIPRSYSNARLEIFEHYLQWLAPNGAVRQWLFSSTEGEEENNRKNFFIEGLDTIRSVPVEKRDMYSVESKSLSLEEFRYVSSVLDSNRVYKVYKNGSRVPVAISPTRTRRPNQLKEFFVRFDFIETEAVILNL